MKRTKRGEMKCHTCGENYTEPSFGGPNICPRCDCGIKPNGERITTREAIKIGIRYKKGLKPYLLTK